MKIILLFLLIFFTGFCFNNISAEENLAGKDLFYKAKGKFGSCNTCHPGGNSAGRWNFETSEIDPEEGKKIAVLKGIGKKKKIDQIERSIKLMKKWFDFKLTDEEISRLAEYVATL